ncbi:MAG: double-strand break repair helicase AddA [Alphaproteobacteria bacterium]
MISPEEIELSRKRRGIEATEEQRRASDPQKSVWVQASAGTGKTKVLSDRVLRLLLTGVRPEKILCLTYTKAAAVEMSSRIAGRLSRWAVLEDEKLYKELESLLGKLPNGPKELEKIEAMARKLFAILLDTPGGMKIQTIHSFCQEVLKRFPLEAKVSPYFEVMDDRASNEALLEIKKELISYIEKNPESSTAKALSFLTQNVSEYSFPEIMNSITSNRSKITRMFEKFGSFEKIVVRLKETLKISNEKPVNEQILEFMSSIDREICSLIMNAWFKGSKTDIAKAEQIALILSEKPNMESYEQYVGLFLTKDGEVRKQAGTKGAVEAYPDLQETFEKEADKILDFEKKLKALNVFKSTQAVLALAEDLISGYNAYKTSHSKMDYEDLIVLTRNLLQNQSVADWVLFKLDGGVDHVLIDEAQDTSPDQWEIVKSLTAEFFSGQGAREQNRTIFAVGDRKQSIYSFQGADPREFEKSKAFYKEKIESFEEVRLGVSFRSAETILDLVNYLFRDEQAKKGVVLEGEDITHNPFRLGDAGKIELWAIPEAEKKPREELEWHLPIQRVGKESPSVNLAKEIAQKIKKSVESRDILASQNRPVRYKDFLVLVQRRNSFVDELVRECKNLNVNIAGVDKIKLLEQIAIQDLIALAKFVLLPTDDLNLAAVLKSPCFGLTDDDLIELCCARGKLSLWAILGINDKYATTYVKLQSLSSKLDFCRPFEFYSFILTKLEGRKNFIQRMGREVLDGIDEFMNLTLRFEQEHIPNLQNFVSWIEEGDVEIKREQEQSDLDAVRIMTVHGSKGLQAPIVILPDTVRVVSTSKEGGMLWDDLFYYPLRSSDYEDVCLSIKEKDNELSLEEYRRLLYVALTRAEDRLCLCGYTSKGKAKEESWYGLLERKFLEIAQKQEEDLYVYENTQRIPVKEKILLKEREFSIPEFSWLEEIPEAENPLAKPYTPSKEDDEEEVLLSPLGENGESRYRRGTIIHKLLQFLPSTKPENRQKIMVDFLEKNAFDFSLAQKTRIIEEVSHLFENPSFEVLFGKNSFDEVPIMGEVDGKIISAQMDRIVVLADKVMIVDFKTNRPAAKELKDVPQQYIKQLRAYKKLVERIYEKKAVETYILWTDIAELMKIDL